MICPECGEMVNFINDNNITCRCGWHGTFKQWRKAIEDDDNITVEFKEP